MHSRLTVNCVAWQTTTVQEDLATCLQAGISSIGLRDVKLEASGWDGAIKAVQTSGIDVDYLIVGPLFSLDRPELWESELAHLRRKLDAAAALGARCAYGMTGPGGGLTYEAALAALTEAVAPALEHARALGLPLLVETTNQIRQDTSIVYTVRDQVDLAETTGLGLCIDAYYAWREPGLRQTLPKALPHLHLVQIADWARDTRSIPDRVVPGDGEVPLEGLLRAFLDAGWAGPFDLEVLGPRIDAEGPLSAVRRGLDTLAELLDRLEA